MGRISVQNVSKAYKTYPSRFGRLVEIIFDIVSGDAESFRSKGIIKQSESKKCSANPKFHVVRSCQTAFAFQENIFAI